MNPSLLYNYTTYKNEISSYLLTNNRRELSLQKLT